jgi:hypothetical protein
LREDRGNALASFQGSGLLQGDVVCGVSSDLALYGAFRPERPTVCDRRFCCMSAATRSLPAFFSASLRSAPLGIAKASASASLARASQS